MLADFVAGEPAVGMVERDDGSVFPHATDYYVAPFRSWWPQERRAMRLVRGRVLDFGSGAGRVGLHLQGRGHEVVGVDVSPIAVEISRQRGLWDARVGTLDGAIGEDEIRQATRRARSGSLVPAAGRAQSATKRRGPAPRGRA